MTKPDIGPAATRTQGRGARLLVAALALLAVASVVLALGAVSARSDADDALAALKVENAKVRQQLSAEQLQRTEARRALSALGLATDRLVVQLGDVGTAPMWPPRKPQLVRGLRVVCPEQVQNYSAQQRFWHRFNEELTGGGCLDWGRGYERLR
jgi:hypothetical protein